MKNKLVILSLILTGFSFNTLAQEDGKKKYYVEKFTDNFFISLGAGAQACVNPDNFYFGFGKAITPQITLSVGKLITPVWGVRGQLTGWSSKLNTDYGMSWTQKYGPNGGEDNYFKRKKNYITLNGDAMVNLSNLFVGYREDRKFEFSIFGGPTLTVAKSFEGWQHKIVDVTYLGQPAKEIQSTPIPDKPKLHWLVGASAGLAGKYNIDEFWAIDLEARASVGPPIWGVVDRAKADGALSLTAGVSYTFGGKKFKECNAGIIQDPNMNERINNCRREVEALQSELTNTKNALRDEQNKPPREVVKTVEIHSVGPYAIFFELGKANISDRGKVNLKLAAKRIKENPNQKYKLAGYTDKTGSSELNQRLSEQRAKAVYDALLKEGVNPSQLEIIANGQYDNMFGANELNRVVILE